RQWRFNVSLQSGESVAGGEGALGTERDGEDAIVLGEVGSGRTCALRLAEGDRLSVKRGLDLCPLHVDCEPETGDRVPVLDHPHNPEVEAGVASDTVANENVLRSTAAATTEQSAVDDRVAIPDLSVGPVHRGREIGQPEVLVAAARRPRGGQIELTAIEVDRIREHAKRHGVAGTEQAGAGQVVAARVSARALAVVEEAAEVIARTGPGRLDVDAREHRPTPLVIRIETLACSDLRASRAADLTGYTVVARVVGRIDLV